MLKQTAETKDVPKEEKKQEKEVTRSPEKNQLKPTKKDTPIQKELLQKSKDHKVKPKIKVTTEIKKKSGSKKITVKPSLKAIDDPGAIVEKKPSVKSPKPTKRKGKKEDAKAGSTNGPLFEKVEQVILKLLFNNVIPTKQGLIESVKIELKKLKISASEIQITNVVDTLTEGKKIGFNRKPPAPGWKLII